MTTAVASEHQDLELVSLAELTAQALAADPNAPVAADAVPFGAGLGLSGDLDPELGLAGAKAHNRWLADLCSVSPERRCGAALVPITGPIDATLAEITWAKEHGLGAVMIPARVSVPRSRRIAAA